MGRISKLIGRLGLKRSPRWEVHVHTGVMFRECARTRRIQYRDCGTNRWIEVSTYEELNRFIEDARQVSRQSPVWAQGPQPGPPEIRSPSFGPGGVYPMALRSTTAQARGTSPSPESYFETA